MKNRKSKRFNTEDTEVRGEGHGEEHRLKPVLLLGGAADAGEDAKFAQDDDVEIGALVVAGKIGFGAAVVALDGESGVAFVLGAGRVLHAHLKFFGIVVDGDDVGLAGAANAQIPKNGFLAGKRIRLGNGVHCSELGHKSFPTALQALGAWAAAGLPVSPCSFDLAGLADL